MIRRAAAEERGAAIAGEATINIKRNKKRRICSG